MVTEPEQGRGLEALDIIVVEDQALIAMDTEDTLRQLGARSIRLAQGVAEALTAIAAQAPDCAVLDFNLGDENAEPVADVLSKLGIPFVFATGYGDLTMAPDRFSGTPFVQKPVSRAALEARLLEAIRGRLKA